ncbi:MAG: O-antigen ligase family protein [Bryobacteraceae bacterium]
MAVASASPVSTEQAAREPERLDTAGEGGGSIADFGFLVLCAYFVSGYISEWLLRLTGSSGYIARALTILLPVMWILSPARFRGFRHFIGICWLGFAAWLIIDVPFSAWRGGSFDLLENYLPRSYMIFFFVAALAVNVRRCRQLTYLGVAGAAITLFSVIKFGVSDGERLRVPGSLFYGNSNDLALGLLLGITQFTFLFYREGVIKKAFATVCIGVSVIYMLRTGSRGCMLASAAYVVLIFILSRKKLLVLGVAVVAAAIGFAALPSNTLQRLMLLGVDQNMEETTTDIGARDSRLERTALIYRSLKETAKHPLFGLGPGQFAVAVAGEAKKNGEWSAWVGTHNSYTQVSSECGLPAFFCYCAVIVLCFKLSYQVFRATRDNPAYSDINGMSFVLLSGIFVYAIATFFFHMAYSGNLPTLSGLALALYLAVKPLLPASQRRSI